MKKYYKLMIIDIDVFMNKDCYGFKSEPTFSELINWLSAYEIPLNESVLGVGCGEGRDIMTP